VLSQAALKLISFELAKDLELNFYFEAALLAQAYQLLVQYQVPFAKLDEFWDESSKKLVRFSDQLTCFLAEYQLRLPTLPVSETSGIALKKTPLGIFLLDLLQLKETAKLDSISSVFTANFIEFDLVKRHAVDAKLRHSLHAYVDVVTYFDKVEEFANWKNFAAFTLPKAATLSHWLKIVKNFLQDLQVQVPATFFADMEHYFLPADTYLAPLPYSEFLEHFDMFLEDTYVMPADVEGYPEVEEQEYTNSFIPARLQREYNIVFPSPLRGRRWSAGPDEGDGQGLRSPLIRHFVPASNARGEGKAYRRIGNHADVLQDPARLNLRAQTGGAAILSQQVACPFKAFGHFQLKLHALVQDEAWLSQKLKGIAIHRILEKIWDELKTQKNLLSLNDEALTNLVRTTATNIVFGLSHNMQFFLPKSLANLEVQRLTELILTWLGEEKQRPEFKVHALETQSLAYLGDLVIKLRLDRIDELPDGTRLVIDYKTGNVNVKEWLEEPLGDVQLPLYVLTTSAAGALLAEVNNNLHFSGIVAEDVENFSEVKAATQIAHRSWEDLKTFWQRNINALARDISQGIAHVVPTPGACDYCDLQAVCRIKEIPSPLAFDAGPQDRMRGDRRPCPSPSSAAPQHLLPQGEKEGEFI
jgi:PD-(D/E)XK nuclease superfamily